jgi:hypothetical protein
MSNIVKNATEPIAKHISQPVALPAELETELEKFSVLPTIKGRNAAVDFLKTDQRVKVGIAKYAITKAVTDRTLEHFLISDCLYFSERGLVRWALSQLRTAASA